MPWLQLTGNAPIKNLLTPALLDGGQSGQEKEHLGRPCQTTPPGSTTPWELAAS